MLVRVQVRELAVPGAWEFSPNAFEDRRGVFAAPFQQPAFERATGQALNLAQVSHSVSTRGVIRGVHFADVPPGQAKYVHCVRGSILDVVVDTRAGSPTFGRWDAARLDSASFRAVYLAEGLGHAFTALTDDAAVVYLCSAGYDPAAEHGVHPLDPALGLPWPADPPPVLSDKDGAAPTLAAAHAAGALPRWQDCQQRYAQLRA